MFLLRDILQASICLIQSPPLSRDRRTGFQMHYTVPTFNLGFWDKICVFWPVRQGSYPLSHLDSSDLFAMFVCLCFFSETGLGMLLTSNLLCGAGYPGTGHLASSSKHAPWHPNKLHHLVWVLFYHYIGIIIQMPSTPAIFMWCSPNRLIILVLTCMCSQPIKISNFMFRPVESSSARRGLAHGPHIHMYAGKRLMHIKLKIKKNYQARSLSGSSRNQQADAWKRF